MASWPSLQVPEINQLCKEDRKSQLNKKQDTPNLGTVTMRLEHNSTSEFCKVTEKMFLVRNPLVTKEGCVWQVEEEDKVDETLCLH